MFLKFCWKSFWTLFWFDTLPAIKTTLKLLYYYYKNKVSEIITLKPLKMNNEKYTYPGVLARWLLNALQKKRKDIF